jgi:PAS domain S-box-containing protein
MKLPPDHTAEELEERVAERTRELVAANEQLKKELAELRRSEAAFRDRDANMRMIVAGIPAGIAFLSPTGEVELVSEQLIEYFGKPLKELKDWAKSDVVHPDDLPGVIDAFKHSIARGEAAEHEQRLRRFDGAYRWINVRRAPVRDASGRILGWCALHIDIDERKRAEEALKQSEMLLAEGQRLSVTGTYSWRVETDELTFSDELCRIFEFEQNSVVTTGRILGRVHPDDHPLLVEKMARARAGQSNPEYEIRLRMPDDRLKHLRVFGRLIHHDGGRQECLGAVQDVTQRRLAEETRDKVRSELSHVTRIMSLGALTASIAHEVNQPLAGIITNADTCLRMLAADPPNIEGARATARRTIRDGNRAGEVIARLRALFGKNAAVSETVDLNEMTRGVLALLFSDLLRNQVILRVELDDEPLLVAGDRVQLQQVILNLVRNASDAMSEVTGRSRDLLVRADRLDGCGRLIVKDAGVGLDSLDAERLFEAFYTTKSDGMGIGLSLSRSIIESHGGKLWAEPNVGPGATFAFFVPRLADGARDGRPGDPAQSSERAPAGLGDRSRRALK